MWRHSDNPICAGEVTARSHHVVIEQSFALGCPSPHPLPLKNGEREQARRAARDVPYLAEVAADYAGSAKHIMRKSGTSPTCVGRSPLIRPTATTMPSIK